MLFSKYWYTLARICPSSLFVIFFTNIWTNLTQIAFVVQNNTLNFSAALKVWLFSNWHLVRKEDLLAENKGLSIRKWNSVSGGADRLATKLVKVKVESAGPQAVLTGSAKGVIGLVSRPSSTRRLWLLVWSLLRKQCWFLFLIKSICSSWWTLTTLGAFKWIL